MCRSIKEQKLYDRRVNAVNSMARWRKVGFTFINAKLDFPTIFPGPRQFNDFMKEVMANDSDLTSRSGKNGVKTYYKRPNLYINTSRNWDRHSVLNRRVFDIQNTSSSTQAAVV